MAAQPAVHPSEDALRAFALGKVDDTTSSVLMSHLDGCPDCCKFLAALSGDDFLNRLRQAQDRSSTPAPARSLADAAGTEPHPASLTPIPNLPPELAANPQYEILRELGRGGMGVVYLAKNKLMDRLEVLKAINKTLLDHPGAIERFLREIRSAAKLSHANVVAAYSAVQSGDLLAFAMEYIEGQDLASLVKTRGPLPVMHACYYVQQAALGLQHAHEEKMVHRDIKPQNLMLTHKGKKHVVKVLDFGLAKATREKTDDTGLTGEGKMLGTPDYIAPEQSLDAAKADIRADIYSLGCTLYYLLSGRPPFSGSSLAAVLMAHQMEGAKPLNLVRPEVSEELAAVVRKMMAKSPAKRYQTPLEVVQALAPFVKQGTTPKSSPELSSGEVEAKAAVKKAERTNPPPVPAAPEAKKQPEPANVWGSLTEESIASDGPRKRAVIRKNRAATVRERSSRYRWLFGGGLGIGVLLLALLGMLASGVFKVKTKDGTIVLENLAADAEVLVDGAKVIVKWDNGGKKAQISVPPGRHKIEATKDGFTVIGEEVEIEDGKQRVLTARLVRPLPSPDENKAPLAPDAANAKEHPKGELDKLPETITNSIGMKFVLVKPGKFLMGSPPSEDGHDNTEHQHEVEITQSFYMGVYLVTQEQYESVMGHNPSFFSAAGGGKDSVKGMDTRQFPVDKVSWLDAVEFCRWLSERPEEKSKGRTYRLPTEAEWEYACRGGPSIKNPSPPFHFGGSLSSTQANFAGGAPYGGASHGPFLKRTSKVGSYPGNPLGLYDFHGNVLQWCADWYDPEYYKKRSPTKDPQGPETGQHRVMRGGFWYGHAIQCRAAIRFNHNPSARYNYFGFRLVLAVAAAPADAGFVPLFNGKDKTGWQTHPSLPDNWRVVPGANGNVLTCSGPTSHLFSERGDYQDFHLRAEARINDGGNSGLYFRTQFGPDYPKGYEVQINSTHGDPIKTGSLYPSFNPKLTKEQSDKIVVSDMLVKPKEWFTLDVIAQGNHIVIKVNGKTTVDFVDETNAYNRGRFALQHHDRRTEVDFRKIEIGELK
jgi:formylglycine-generating enzyme required for sulfatase activity/serine/threonine protein kinase